MFIQYQMKFITDRAVSSPTRTVISPRRSQKWSVTLQSLIGSLPHFGVVSTGIRTVAEVNT